MLSRAIVLIDRPKPPSSSEESTPMTHVGGLSLLQRTLYAAQRAGIREGLVLLTEPWPEAEACIRTDPKNVAFSPLVLSPPSGREEAARSRLASFRCEDFLFLSGAWLVDREVLRDLCGTEGPLRAPALVKPARPPAGEDAVPPAALVPAATAPAFLDALKEGDTVRAAARLAENHGNTEELLLEEPKLFPVRSRAECERAEDGLLRGLIKPTESFLSQKFERRISLAITRRLLYSPVTPNLITVFSVLIGLASALLFIGDSRIAHVIGALLLLLSSIIDGCDGELARLKYQESRLGSLLDFLGDNLVHMAVFFCIGFGLALRGEGSVYLWLGVTSALGVLGSAGAVFWRMFLKADSVFTFSTPVRVEGMALAQGKLRRQIDFADKISNRDFIYLILVLAAAGGLWIYAWLSALGSAFYFIYLLYLYRRMSSLKQASPAGGA
ncbi:MAG: CDP-alcohol phosphatidyltransferase family protein [bacterium]